MGGNRETAAWENLGLTLNLIGLAAIGAGMIIGGGFAILGGAVGALCLAGSIANALMPPEDACERCLRECEQQPAQAEAEEPAISPQQAQAEGKQWAASVKAGRNACRRR